MLTTLDGARLSTIGLGCARFGSFNNPASLADCARLVRDARRLGVNVFDTADIYGQGDSERVLGRTLSAERESVVVVTKIGKRFSKAMNAVRPFKPLLKWGLTQMGAQNGVSRRRAEVLNDALAPETLVGAAQASRERLGRIDVLLLHSPTGEELRRADTQAAFARLSGLGVARKLGVSCDDAQSLTGALSLEGVAALELPYSLLESAWTSGLSVAASSREITVFAREVVKDQPQLSPLAAIGRAVDHAGVVCAIVGTTQALHLEQAVGAADFGRASARPAPHVTAELT